MAYWEMPLKTGDNAFMYDGPTGKASDLMASILPYLVIAYYYTDPAKGWQQVLADTILQRTEVVSTYVGYSMTLNVKVSQDVLWSISQAPVTPVGKITGVRGWVTGLGDWAAIPLVNVTRGLEFAVEMQWENRGSTAAKGHGVATLVKPSGQRVSMPVTLQQDAVIPAGGIGYLGTSRVILDEVGSYSLETTLSMEPV